MSQRCSNRRLVNFEVGGSFNVGPLYRFEYMLRTSIEVRKEIKTSMEILIETKEFFRDPNG